MIRTALRIVSALALVATLSVQAGPAQAASTASSSHSGVGQYEHDSDAMPTLVDMMLVRPLGLGVLAAGTVLMLPVGAFTLMTRPTNIKDPFDVLVMEPAKFVFVDPVGQH
jgi:hypothetical protein